MARAAMGGAKGDGLLSPWDMADDDYHLRQSIHHVSWTL